MPVSKIVANKGSRLLVGIVLDRSGSMLSMLDETIKGTNEQFKALRESDDADNTYVCAWSFNDKVAPIFTNKRDADGKPLPELLPVAALEDVSASNYIPGGCTAMYDGVGDAIKFFNAEATLADDVMLIIISDGMENASNRYSAENISSQVKELQSAGWNFTYIGANQDLTEIQKTLGIADGNMLSWDYTQDGTRYAHNSVSSMLGNYTALRSAAKQGGMQDRTCSTDLYSKNSVAPASPTPEGVQLELIATATPRVNAVADTKEG